jgi:hypothetical protein
MKRRAWRVTIGAAVLAVALVAVLAVAYWSTVRDHVEAWHFQLTRETATIEPDPARKRIPVRVEVPGIRSSALPRLLQDLANYSGYLVICAPEQNMMLDTPILLVARIHKDIAEVEICDADIKAGLKSAGYRVLEQRFPRRAYVVIRNPEPTTADLDLSFPSMGYPSWSSMHKITSR